MIYIYMYIVIYMSVHIDTSHVIGCCGWSGSMVPCGQCVSWPTQIFLEGWHRTIVGPFRNCLEFELVSILNIYIYLNICIYIYMNIYIFIVLYIYLWLHTGTSLSFATWGDDICSNQKTALVKPLIQGLFLCFLHSYPGILGMWGRQEFL